MGKLFTILRIRYVQVILLLILYSIYADNISIDHKNALYSFSLVIKSCLSIILPFIVCAYMAYTVAFFEKKAIHFIFILVCFEFVSNFFCVWHSYLSAFCFLKIQQNPISLVDSDSLQQIFSLPIQKPSWLTCDKGVLLGILIGLFVKNRNTIAKMKDAANSVMTHFFSKLIPFFILGFYANIHHKNIAKTLFIDYGYIALQLVFIINLYIFFVYLVASNFSVKATFLKLKNMVPAWLMGFTTGCSLSTMPLTIKCASKNAKDPNLIQGIIPATTNIQQVGDCIMMSFIGAFLYSQFFNCLPDLFTWFKFSLLFTLARFTVTAVVGGAVFVLIPIFESQLNFNPEMVSIFLTLNMIFDPIVTASNILGNGGLCLLFEKIYKKILY